MSDEHQDEFPLFVIVDENMDKDVGIPASVQQLNMGDTPALAFFTDEALAQDFCKIMGQPALRPKAVEAPQIMLGIAKGFQSQGTKEVTRNPTRDPRIAVLDIETFIVALHRACRLSIRFPIFMAFGPNNEIITRRINSIAPECIFYFTSRELAELHIEQEGSGKLQLRHCNSYELLVTFLKDVLGLGIQHYCVNLTHDGKGAFVYPISDLLD